MRLTTLSRFGIVSALGGTLEIDVRTPPLPITVRHMTDYDPSVTETAKQIVERRQRAPGIRAATALWPDILSDVHALSLDQATETALARACYGLLFVVPIAD